MLLRRLSSLREGPHTAIEVAEILAHLVEREPQSENAFQGVYRQTRRQPLAADRGDGLGVAVKGGFETSSPSSRCRVISYRPTATKGPTSAKPEASGKRNCRAF